MANNNIPYDSTQRLIEANTTIYDMYNTIFKMEYGNKLEVADPQVKATLDVMKEAIEISKSLIEDNPALLEYLPAMQNMNNRKFGTNLCQYDIEVALKKRGTTMPYERIQHSDIHVDPQSNAGYLLTIENIILQQFLIIAQQHLNNEQQNKKLKIAFLKYKYSVSYINSYLENHYLATSFNTIPVCHLSFEMMAQIMGISRQHYLDFENKIAFDIAIKELRRILTMTPKDEKSAYGYTVAQMRSYYIQAALIHVDEEANNELSTLFAKVVENPSYKIIHGDNIAILNLVDTAFNEAASIRMNSNKINGFDEKPNHLN